MNATDHDHVTQCPACGEAIFANVPCVIGAPVNRILPLYLLDVVLDRRGAITAWRYANDSLAASVDFHADGYEPSEVDVYCDNGHDVARLVERSRPLEAWSPAQRSR